MAKYEVMLVSGDKFIVTAKEYVYQSGREAETPGIVSFWDQYEKNGDTFDKKVATFWNVLGVYECGVAQSESDRRLDLALAASEQLAKHDDHN